MDLDPIDISPPTPAPSIPIHLSTAKTKSPSQILTNSLQRTTFIIRQAVINLLETEPDRTRKLESHLCSLDCVEEICA